MTGNNSSANNPQAFEQDFQRLVIPKLQPFVRLGAYLVQQGLEQFTEAHQRVIDAARKYGASHLSDQAFFDLDSWIDQSLLAWIDEPPPAGTVTPARLAKITGER